MKTEAGVNKPPYLPYSTFKNFLASLKAGALPSRIDKSLLDRYSGSMQSWLISALKFFNLIDETGKPQPSLSTIADADEPRRKKIWKEIFDKAYAPLISGLDLTRATPGELSERFSKEGLSGETLGKCHGFFASAAADADVPIAEHLKIRPKPSGPRKSRKARNGAPLEAPPIEPPAAAPAQKTMREMLLEKFPAFDPSWAPQIQTKWFESFGKLMQKAEEADNE